MWSVGISVSPCDDAARIGYDNRQINRITIRMAQYFLSREMRVIFGHDWRDDGVMRAIANFAMKVTSNLQLGDTGSDKSSDPCESSNGEPRMLNVIADDRESLSELAVEAHQDGDGVLQVYSICDDNKRLRDLALCGEACSWESNVNGSRVHKLTSLRKCITHLLNPGCRICLGGSETVYEGEEPGVMQEGRLALQHGKPLYLLGGFGGATKCFAETDELGKSMYWPSMNGLEENEKRELFNTTDIERALHLVTRGIKSIGSPNSSLCE